MRWKKGEKEEGVSEKNNTYIAKKREKGKKQEA